MDKELRSGCAGAEGARSSAVSVQCAKEARLRLAAQKKEECLKRYAASKARKDAEDSARLERQLTAAVLQAEWKEKRAMRMEAVHAAEVRTAKSQDAADTMLLLRTTVRVALGDATNIHSDD